MMYNKLELVAGVLTFPEIELPKVERVPFFKFETGSSLIDDMKINFSEYKKKTKYHRKTNYKPKYTL